MYKKKLIFFFNVLFFFKFKMSLIFTLFLCFCATTTVYAQTLYAFPMNRIPGFPSRADTAILDPATALLTSTVGQTSLSRIEAATFVGSTLYVAGRAGNDHTTLDCLYKIDLETGGETLVGCDPVESSQPRIRGLAADSTGTLYALVRDFAEDSEYLARVDVDNGDLTSIGKVGDSCNGFGIEFGPDDTLYGHGCYFWGTIDVTSGAFSPIAETGFVTTDMSYNPTTGVMYAMVHDEGPGSLYSVDLATGARTQIGAPFEDDFSIYAIACKSQKLTQFIFCFVLKNL